MALITAGCGSQGGSAAAVHGAGRAGSAASTSGIGGNADSASILVIQAWSRQLAAGHVRQASLLFALPSRLQISIDTAPVIVHRLAQVIAFNSLLPCAARLLRADRRGRFVNALFLLGNRRDSPCDAPGASARVSFVVRGGLITEWLRAPSEPKDPGSTPSSPAPVAPGSPGAPGIPATPSPSPGAPNGPSPGGPAPAPTI